MGIINQSNRLNLSNKSNQRFMKKHDPIFIAGSAGMVGSAIIRKLLSLGYTNLTGSFHTRKPDAAMFSGGPEKVIPEGLKLVPVDLTQQTAVTQFFKEEKPAHVFLAAARVGGIHANNSYPAWFIRDNLVIQNNIIHAAYLSGVERLLFLGSSCIYPKLAPQAHAGKPPVDRSVGTYQRALRDCQDSRHQDVRSLQSAVWDTLHGRDADPTFTARTITLTWKIPMCCRR